MSKVWGGYERPGWYDRPGVSEVWGGYEGLVGMIGLVGVKSLGWI